MIKEQLMAVKNYKSSTFVEKMQKQQNVHHTTTKT